MKTLSGIISEVIAIRAYLGFTGPAERYRIRVICAQMWVQRQ